jgi:hypothetical protein
MSSGVSSRAPSVAASPLLSVGSARSPGRSPLGGAHRMSSGSAGAGRSPRCHASEEGRSSAARGLSEFGGNAACARRPQSCAASSSRADAPSPGERLAAQQVCPPVPLPTPQHDGASRPPASIGEQTPRACASSDALASSQGMEAVCARSLSDSESSHRGSVDGGSARDEAQGQAPRGAFSYRHEALLQASDARASESATPIPRSLRAVQNAVGAAEHPPVRGAERSPACAQQPAEVCAQHGADAAKVSVAPLRTAACCDVRARWRGQSGGISPFRASSLSRPCHPHPRSPFPLSPATSPSRSPRSAPRPAC